MSAELLPIPYTQTSKHEEEIVGYMRAKLKALEPEMNPNPPNIKSYTPNLKQIRINKTQAIFANACQEKTRSEQTQELKMFSLKGLKGENLEQKQESKKICAYKYLQQLVQKFKGTSQEQKCDIQKKADSGSKCDLQRLDNNSLGEETIQQAKQRRDSLTARKSESYQGLINIKRCQGELEEKHQNISDTTSLSSFDTQFQSLFSRNNQKCLTSQHMLENVNIEISLKNRIKSIVQETKEHHQNCFNSSYNTSEMQSPYESFCYGVKGMSRDRQQRVDLQKQQSIKKMPTKMIKRLSTKLFELANQDESRQTYEDPFNFQTESLIDSPNFIYPVFSNKNSKAFERGKSFTEVMRDKSSYQKIKTSMKNLVQHINQNQYYGGRDIPEKSAQDYLLLRGRSQQVTGLMTKNSY